MFSLPSVWAFWSMPVINRNQFFSNMQALYSETLQFSECLSAARLFNRKKKKANLKATAQQKSFL